MTTSSFVSIVMIGFDRLNFFQQPRDGSSFSSVIKGADNRTRQERLTFECRPHGVRREARCSWLLRRECLHYDRGHVFRERIVALFSKVHVRFEHDLVFAR